MTCDGPTTETGSPSDLTIYSRIEGGPDNALRSAIVQAFTEFENSELAQRAESLKKVPLDGRRGGMPLVSCDQACTENEDFKGLVCRACRVVSLECVVPFVKRSLRFVLRKTMLRSRSGHVRSDITCKEDRGHGFSLSPYLSHPRIIVGR
jgi:hypothetical protein